MLSRTLLFVYVHVQELELRLDVQYADVDCAHYLSPPAINGQQRSWACHSSEQQPEMKGLHLVP